MKKTALVAAVAAGFALSGSARTIYVATNGQHVAPFTNSWIAATNIQDAVDVATNGDVVLVGDGTYSLPTTVNITNGITLKSLGGPQAAVLNGRGSVRGLYLDHTNARVEGFTIRSCTVTAYGSPGIAQGGGIYASRAALIDACIIFSNRVEGYGSDYSFDASDGYGQGAGIFATSNLTIRNCLIYANVAQGEGGDSAYDPCMGWTGEGGDGYGEGGGLYATGQIRVENSTIASNRTIGIGGYGGTGWSGSLPGTGYADGGGVYVVSAATGFANSIIQLNMAGDAVQNWTGGTYTYTCAAPQPDGAGNIPDHPQFIAPATGNYHLASASPCIDAGRTNDVTTDRDLEGNPRIVNGTVDMGAYEHPGAVAGLRVTLFPSEAVTAGAQWRVDGGAWQSSGTFLSGLSVGIHTVNCSTVAGFLAPADQTTSIATGRTALVNGLYVRMVPPSIGVHPVSQTNISGASVSFKIVAGGPAPLFYQWHKDAVLIPAATNSGYGISVLEPSDAGEYRCVVSNMYGAVTSAVATLTVQGGIHYVRLDSPAPTHPYTNWATAATNIQDAVDAATMPGSLVLVTNGVYATGGRKALWMSLTNRLVITNAIRVRSVNGPAVTIIQGAKDPVTTNGNAAVRCVWMTNGASLAGFTLANGATRANSFDAESRGGGLWCPSTNAFVSNCVFAGNSAFEGGGAYGGTLEYCTLTGNWAQAQGGGVCTGRLNNCMLAANTASLGGGSYFSSLENCMLTGNSVKTNGGGAFGGTLTNCTLIGNSAYLYGGGVYTSRLNNCTLTGNVATNYGGGSAYGMLQDCILLSNSAAQYGGGTYYGTLNNCTLTGNSATNYGGGSYYGALKNCTLSGNSGYYGGGSYYGTLSNCMFVANTARYSGGGCYGGALYNCALTGNSATNYGGGSYDSSLYNCTVIGNSAPNGGGGVRYGSVYNSIVYHNMSPYGANYNGGTFNDSCTTPLPSSGTNNIADNPLLLNSSHIASNSPCVGAGQTNYSKGVDIDGEPWRVPPAMGCDEPTRPITGSLTVALSSDATNAVLNYPIRFDGIIQGVPISNLWSFGDGEYLANQTFEVSHAWATTGLYAVVLRAWNDDHPGGVAATVQVRVVTGVYYVNASNATPSPPYESWGTAATNIQNAVDAATLPGSLVLVTNGLYGAGGRPATGMSLTNRVTITNTITVRSVNGPAVTIIQGNRHPETTNGNAAVRCVWMTNGATLSGFTLTNGATRETSGSDGSGGGIWCPSTNAAISNCVLSGNAAYYYGGGTHYGLLNNCTVTGNTAGNRGGGSYYAKLIDCVFSSNSARNSGGGSYYGTLSNCTLTGNAADTGGGSFNSLLSNCTLTENSARSDGGGAYNGGMKNSLFIGNTASNNGGGIYSGSVTNCMVSGNSANMGGGAYRGSLYNCTLTGNSAGSSGGGSSDSGLYNCIAYYNTAPVSPNYSGNPEYSCITPTPLGGTGNITNEPRLASATHLAADSPCIGKGRSSYASGTDIDGQAWRSPPAMGCDEVYAGSITGALSISIWASHANVAIGFPVQFRSDISGRATASAWQWGDGTAIASNQPYADHAFSTTGTYAVVFYAYNETYPLGVAATVTVQVAAQAIHYVNLANPTPSSPFASWATAATNIQDAVDAASQPGALVLVSNGVYATGGRVVYGSMTNRVAITKPVTVRSVNGPGATIIQGAWHPGQTNGNAAIRCVYVGTNAVLSGFTLTNGATRASGDEVREQSGGGAWCDVSGALSNCIISGNTAYKNGGGLTYGMLDNCTLTGNSTTESWGGGGGSYYGVLNNCMLTGNIAETYGGGAYNCSLNNCTLSGNSAWSGGGTYDSTLNNCTISGNSANSGGGAVGGLLNNCTLSGNSARDSGGGSYSATLGNCALLNNSANNSGGGSYYGTLSNCTLTGNSAATNGGGAFQGTLRNCALAGNNAQYGGGSYQGTLINCTLGGNRANQGGGSYSGTLTNCIVYHNRAQEGPNYSGSLLGYSCTAPAYSGGPGNITDDPRLASASHLLADSPCIGAGNRTNASGTDIDGETWQNPPSMGCDEVYAGAITGALSVSIWAAPTNVAVGFPIQFRADVAGRPTGIAWQWGDGSPGASNQPFATHAFASVGTYAVVLTAYNETYPLGVAATVMVQVVTQAVHYVDINNATPVSPFSSWVTAATNIQDAVDAASQPGALVLVSNGVYATGGRVVHGGLTNRVVITNAVGVRSVNGPGTTIIQGAWHPGTTNGNAAVRCAVVGNNAVLSGFTLTNGATAMNIYYGNWPECDGGGAWCEAFGVLSNCIISGNSAYKRGGGACYGTLDTCMLAGNSASFGGGAYYSTLNNCTISGNSAPNNYGGGAYYGTLSNCTLTGNSAYVGGGSSHSSLADCTLTGNTASSAGGGSYYGTLNNCTLTGNTATRDGGGAYDSALNNCTLTANVATNGGGSAYGALTGCILSGNTATNGGGSYAGTLNNCLLTNNSAVRSGGGSYTGRLNNCTISGNTAAYSGGGACNGILSNCLISGNTAGTFGGGAHFGTLNNCTISGNSAGSGGGVHSGTPNNCAIFGNTAVTNGGGSYGGTLKNCTLTGNSADDSGGGTYASALQNCIAYYNTALNGPNYNGGSVNYSCTTPVPSGTGNITNEPALASASHLAAGSPCIGAGSTNASGSDIDGEAWRNPPPMGCDEVHAGAITGALSISAWASPPNAAVGFPIQFRADIAGRTTASAWQWGDGSAVTSNQPYVTHAFAAAGTYFVVLRAYNETHPSGVAATVTVQVAAQVVHYVNISNATPSSPFSSWATAATNIQDAIDAASQAGALVLVSNGMYAAGGRVVHGSMTNRVAITKPVVVRSVNGPNATIIQGARHPGATNGNAAVRCAYVGTNALLSGFALTNGATRASGDILREQSGGGIWCEVSGVLSNCTVAGNAANSAGGGVFYGTLDNCLVVGNMVATNGGGVAYSTLNNCTLSGNSTYSNYAKGGGAYYGTLNNCTISSNTANGYSSSGGGTYYGTLNNCTITGNSATEGGGASYGTLQNCTLAGNSAGIAGGGANNGTLNNCMISGNSAGVGGGSHYGTLNNCAIFGNSAATNGGGAYNGTLNNCTISGNSAAYAGGGSVSGTRNNCIVYFNTAGDMPNFSGGTFNYSCTTPAPSGGTGNITNEPGLASPSHLATNSPCIGAGSSTNALGSDIDGEGWSNPPSMGCDEVYAGAITGALGVSIWAVPTNAAVGFAIQFRADITGRTTRSTWQWADGSAGVNNQPYATHAFTTAGAYAVVLRAYNETHPSGVAATVTVQVATQAIHYVNIGNATPSSPFTSWGTAATNIQDAVDAASQPGALVLVSNGVYATGGRVVIGALTNRVAITKPIMVRSVNGPGATIIRGARHPGETNGDAAVRCVYVGTNAVLSGFTLTNGATRTVYEPKTDNSGGGAWCAAYGVLSNCTLVGNAAYYYGGGSCYGTLNNCTLAGNSADQDGGGSYYGTLNNCTLTGNRGGGSHYGTLNNCTLTGNSDYTGGGSCYGTLNNCTLTNNSAYYGGGSYYSTLNNCTLTDNLSSNVGGGAYYGTLNNCRLAGNSAFNSGGGAYDSTLNNSLLIGNTALTNGGGSCDGTLNSCTLTDNSAGASGGGSYTGRLNNCIVYFNTASTGANYQASWLVNSCTTPDPGGTRNMTNDPLFVNAGAGNYRLSTNSPCLDQGTNIYVQGTTDLDGNPRIVNNTVDMGAYEYQIGVPAPVGYWAWASAITNGKTNYSDCATSDGYPNLLKYATGSSPTNSDDFARVSGTRSNGLPVLVFHRNTDVDDATLIVQGANAISNGAIWSGLATNINGSWGGASNVSESGSGNPVTCYVQDVLPLLSNRFLRLKVTYP